MTTPADAHFLRTALRDLADRPLEPDDPRWVADLHVDAGADPTQPLVRGIVWQGDAPALQLLGAVRGGGTSTLLRRLRRDLDATGCRTVLCDLTAHLSTAAPLDRDGVRLAIALAFHDALALDPLLVRDALTLDIGTFLAPALRAAQPQLPGCPEIPAALGEAHDTAVRDLGRALRRWLDDALRHDPDVRGSILRVIGGHRGAVARANAAFFDAGCAALRTHHGADAMPIVLLIDGLDRWLRADADADADGRAWHPLLDLLIAEPDVLRPPGVHAIAAVPAALLPLRPRLAARWPELASSFVGLTPRALDDASARARLRAVVQRRLDVGRLLGSVDRLAPLLDASGGVVGDLLRMLRWLLGRVDALPVADALLAAAIDAFAERAVPPTIDEADGLLLGRLSARTSDRPLTFTAADRARLADLVADGRALPYRANSGRVDWRVHPLALGRAG
ncbi:MAG: hypothetical protein AAF772_03620 [Acidobacteriota bacterium]